MDVVDQNNQTEPVAENEEAIADLAALTGGADDADVQADDAEDTDVVTDGTEEMAAEEAVVDAGAAEEAKAEPADAPAAAPAPAPEPAAEVDDGMDWYVIHTYSGYERKVKQSLEERIRTLELGDQVAELLIPTEDIVEMKAGKKVVTAKKFFPGYLLIRMAMNDRLWHVVKNTPRVTGFVGSGRKPIPLPQVRSGQDRQSDGGVRRGAEAQVPVPQGRVGPHHRRSLHELHGQGRRGGLPSQHAQGHGFDLRA